jgi:hypothetical protein
MLKCECDNCGKITELAESYGHGIGEGNKPYVWESPLGMTLKIEAINHQLCGECLGNTLGALLKERWPDIVWPKYEVEVVKPYDQDSVPQDADVSKGTDTDVPGVRTSIDVPKSSSSFNRPYDDVHPDLDGTGGGTRTD